MSPRVAPPVRRIAGFARPAPRPTAPPRSPVTARSTAARPAAPRPVTRSVPAARTRAAAPRRTARPVTRSAAPVRARASAPSARPRRATGVRTRRRTLPGVPRLLVDGPRRLAAVAAAVVERLAVRAERQARRTLKRHVAGIPYLALGAILSAALLTAPGRISATELPFRDRDPEAVVTVPLDLPGADPTPSATLPPEAVSTPPPLPPATDGPVVRALCNGEPVAPVNLRDEARATAIARVLLRDIGAPQTEVMVAAVRVWIRAEGWDHGYLYNNNPLGMIVRGPMVCGVWNSVGVAILPTPEEGMRLAAIRLQRSANRIYGYHRIVAEARAGDPRTFLQAVAASDWSGVSHYGCKDGSGVSRLEELWALTDPAHATALPCR